MKFSVITPSYNQGKFIRNCLDSVLQQDHPDIEHLVIDAGSTDETIEILSEFPTVEWLSEADQGMSDGINKGFLKATGDWLMWLNCDDYLLPGALSKVAECIRQNPSADVVHGDCLFVKEDMTIIRRKFDHPVDEFTLLFAGCFIPSTSTFLKRSIIDDGSLLDVSYKVCMDWEYYLRLLRKKYRFQYLPEALAGFRWHGSNTSSIHAALGRQEAFKLQCEHITLCGHPAWLKNFMITKLLRRVAQVIRITRRLRTHGRIR